MTIETSCSYTDKEKMYVSSDEKKIINRLLKYHQERPDEVTILKMPEENDGCLYCVVPPSWLKISPPKKYNWTEEQRQAAADRLAQNRAKGAADEED